MMRAIGFLALLLLAPLGSASGLPVRYVIHAGTLLADPTKPRMTSASLMVENGRVVEVRAGHIDPLDFPADATLIDLSALHVMPGLIDLQVHFTGQLGDTGGTERDVTMTDAAIALRAAAYAKRTLEAGFTSVREMSTAHRAMFALRDGIAAGHVPGPRIQVAGRIIGPQLGGGVLRPEIEEIVPRNADCAGADGCRAAIREQIHQGSDTIKIYMNHDLLPDTQPWFSSAEIEALVAESHALRRKVTASAFAAGPIKAGLRAGVDAIVHGVFLDDEAIQLLRDSGAYLIPTLSAADTVRELALDESAKFSAEWRTENLEIHRAMFESFRRAHAAGCRIAFGTDAGWRAHGRNALQFQLMVGAGMTSSEAIISATSGAADAMGWGDQVGRLLPGFQADLIAVRDDPLQDITALQDISFVMKAGAVVLYDSTGKDLAAVASTIPDSPETSGSSRLP